VSDEPGRHAAGPAPADGIAPSDGPVDEFARPDGVEGGFGPRTEPPPYVAAPPTVSPQERAVFGRPPDAEAFAPAPGERITPQKSEYAPVPAIFVQAFGATPDARDGFAPLPGTRLHPAGRPPESPWWKADAPHDPWRDPSSPFWLGRGAIFTGGRPAQVEPDDDQAADEVAFEEPADEELEKPDKVRKLRFGLPGLVVVLLVALGAGLIGGGAGWWLTDHVHDALHRPDVSIAKVETPARRDPGSVAAVAKRVGPAVVSIAVSTPNEFAIGSGVVIDRDGDVLTNNHVVAQAADGKGTIVVTFSDEATAKATIVGRDPTSDLAVIKVPNSQLTVAQLGDSAKLAVGDTVIAIGSPLGLQGTVTEGIVSALSRPVHSSSEDGSSDAYLDAIQTDAAINPGNSGGALVNTSGAVIGINSAGRFETSDGSGGQIPVSGIGYAIPINYARTIALELIHTGKAAHASFGAQGVTALSGLQVGAYVKQVSPGGSAAKAGIAPGDVIVVADGQVVQTFDQIIVIVQQHQPGDRISVTYYPKNSSKKVTKTVTLG
jgi:S1-C subfamily serine protease